MPNFHVRSERGRFSTTVPSTADDFQSPVAIRFQTNFLRAISASETLPSGALVAPLVHSAFRDLARSAPPCTFAHARHDLSTIKSFRRRATTLPGEILLALRLGPISGHQGRHGLTLSQVAPRIIAFM
jgi:hypothetical protein